MLFNSLEFVIFFVVLFALYYFVFKEKTKSQNIVLLVASYFFYAWADWRILPLLIISTLIFYGLGIAIFNSESQKRKNILSTVGVVFGIAVLGYFKYTNFFISSFKDLFDSIGLQTNLHTFKIIVPIGISFYTFRLFSYVIDINRGKYEPARELVAFSTYVAFFPCILSGPIDRPNTLIPQLEKKRIFDYNLTINGLQQILWGAFKKIVIADNCAGIINEVFRDYTIYSGSTMILAGMFFYIQMYADFSGYSDMAIGISKLLGFRVTKNFNYPLFAQNIADYWRRWHISLTSWLTDYVFMPLNVKWRDWGKWGMILAIIVDFVICGFWHGANWTFLAWGLYHGLLYIPLILSGAMFKKTKIETNKWGFPQLKTFGKMLFTFCLVAFGLIIFKSESLIQVELIIRHICTNGLFNIPKFRGLDNAMFLFEIVFIGILLLIEWHNRNKEFGLELQGMKKRRQYLIYIFLIMSIYFFSGNASEFIYFQF